MRLKILSIVLLSLLSACAPTTHEEFVGESDRLFKKMVEVCEKVEHPQDFLILSELKPLYVELAQLMIAAEKQEEKDPQVFNLNVLEAPHAEALKAHLIRIYALEGGKSAVESVAREGLVVLQKAHSKKHGL